MKVLHYLHRILITVILLLAADTTAYSQWAKIAPNLLGNLYQGVPLFNFGGAMTFSDGKLWVGKYELWMSPDSGKSWTKTSYKTNSVILDINFWDRFKGLVATNTDEVSLTLDGGLSWQVINSGHLGGGGQITSAFFLGSPLNIAICSDAPGIIMSFDGGANWIQPPQPVGSPFYGKWFKKGEAYALMPDKSGLKTSLVSTSDFGRTWQLTSGSVDWDCYTFDFDKCDSNTFYLSNEDAVNTADRLSNLFVSNNRGTSWTSRYSAPTDITTASPYFVGAIMNVQGITYAQTRTDGILRSTNKGQTWDVKDGPNISYDTRFIAAASHKIIFAVDSEGSVWKTVLTPTLLFLNDTLHCEDSLTHVFEFDHAGCTTASSSILKILGPDSASYHAKFITQDSILVSFVPRKKGNNTAVLIVSLGDGTSDTVALNGFNARPPFIFSLNPPKLFSGDTLTFCDAPIEQTVLIKTSGCPVRIASERITGTSPNDYSLVLPFNSPVGPDDSIKIIFKPTGFGLRDANYEITFSDSTKIVVPLEGVGEDVPFAYTFSPDTLFTSDTISTCDSVFERKIRISVRGCPVQKVTSQSISGPAASDFTLLRPTVDSLGNIDSVDIHFRSSTAGSRDALYTLTFANGNQIKVVLKGFVVIPHPLSIITADQATDTIGGSVSVPITIGGLARIEDLELVLNYGKELVYLGSYSPANLALDIPGEQWLGRSKLRIPQAQDGSLLGYATFNAFNDSVTGSKVSFDSIKVLTAPYPCEYLLPSSKSSIIKLPSGCGVLTISGYMRNGTVPGFSIRPDPAKDFLLIESTLTKAEVVIDIFDVLGKRLIHQERIFHKSTPERIDVSSLESGVYFLRIERLGNVSSHTFSITK